MVKDSGTEFRFLAAATTEKRIIHNKYVCTVLICQILYLVVDDPGSQKRSKTEPVGFCGIQETVKSIF